MDAKGNVALVERFVAALNERDLETLESLVAPDLRRHSHATPGLEVSSWADFRAFLEQDFQTFPDARQEIELVVAEGPFVAVRVRLTGTQRGPFGPVPATGRAIDTHFHAFLRIADGRLSEMWVEWDNLAILGQLGVAPPLQG